MALSGKFSCLHLIPCGFQMGEVCSYWKYPWSQAVGTYWVPAECRYPTSNLGWGISEGGRPCEPSDRTFSPIPGQAENPLAFLFLRSCYLHPKSLWPYHPGFTYSHTHTPDPLEHLKRGPSPAGSPRLCPSPGSVFIINISLFRSLGFSWYTAFGRFPL